MGDVIILKTMKAPAAASGVIERGGRAMALHSQETALLGLYLDQNDNWTLHTGAHADGFRGYVMREAGAFVMSAWCASGKRDAYRQPNVTFKSEDLALSALRRAAQWIEA